MNKKKILQKRSVIIIALILCLIILDGIIYINDYYHADGYATQCYEQLTANEQVFEGTKKELIIYPEKEYDRGIGLIFYPGGKVEYLSYVPLMSKLAENGITCILAKMPLNLAILDINWAEQVQEQYPEISRWYIGGHSLGGAAASKYLEKSCDTYEGLVLLGAYAIADLTNSDIKVLSIYGSEDGVMNRENYEKNKKNLPKEFEEYVIQGGCHAGFGSYGEQKGDGRPEISADEQQNITVEQIISWIE